jgi:hypothetical protein
MRISQLIVKYRTYSLILNVLLCKFLISSKVSYSFEIAEKQGVWKKVFVIEKLYLWKFLINKSKTS